MKRAGRADRHLVQGRAGAELGSVEFADLDELAPSGIIITTTAVGAPGFAKPSIAPRDCIDSAQRLIRLLDAASPP